MGVADTQDEDPDIVNLVQDHVRTKGVNPDDAATHRAFSRHARLGCDEGENVKQRGQIFFGLPPAENSFTYFEEVSEIEFSLSCKAISHGFTPETWPDEARRR
ncbi:MAG: hypothetical protein MUC58_03590 [Rhizobiaceae bacterium]|nr:hypothetical protein [Rhizobiaceae bacterium]